MNIPVFASINCRTSYEWPQFAKEFVDAGADALELNVFILPSDIEKSQEEIEKTYFDIIEKVKKEVKIPVSLKISYYFSNLASMIKRLSETEIEGLILFNRFYSPDYDIDNLKVYPPAATDVIHTHGLIEVELGDPILEQGGEVVAILVNVRDVLGQAVLVSDDLLDHAPVHTLVFAGGHEGVPEGVEHLALPVVVLVLDAGVAAVAGEPLRCRVAVLARGRGSLELGEQAFMALTAEMRDPVEDADLQQERVERDEALTGLGLYPLVSLVVDVQVPDAVGLADVVQM